jgi:hypothetical protein
MPMKQIDVTPRMERLLDRAADLGQETIGVRTVGTEQMLRATLDDPEAVATQVLAHVGALEAVKAELDRIMSSDRYRRTTR